MVYNLNTILDHKHALVINYFKNLLLIYCKTCRTYKEEYSFFLNSVA